MSVLKKSFFRSGVFMCAALMLAATPVYAEDAAENNPASPWSLSGSATLASEYMTRGFSDSDNKPALQGGVVLSHDSGWAAEIWASNVDYNDSWEAKVEVDFYLPIALTSAPAP